MSDRKLHVAPVLYRAGIVESGSNGSIRLSISSDIPYLRYDWMDDEEYYEQLSHDAGDINLDRLKAGAALLFNHDRDTQLGTIRNPVIESGKCYVDAKMSAAPDVASHAERVREGILKDCSVGYELEGEGIKTGMLNGKPVYKFKWHPFEASLCTIAADISVGVGRQRDKAPDETPKEIIIKDLDSNSELTKKAVTQTTPMADIVTPPADIDVKAERNAAIAEHKAKCKKIDEFVAAVKNPAWKAKAAEVATKHKDGEADFNDFRAEALNFFTSETVIDTPLDGERGIEVIGDRPRNPNQRGLSVGEAFVASKQFIEASKRKGQGARGSSMEFPGVTMLGARGKASLQQRAGWASVDLAAVNITYMPGLIALGVQQLTVMDLLPGGAMSSASLVYPRENGFGTINGVAVPTTNQTSNGPRAQTVGEGGLKPNWDPDLSTETASVKKVAVTTKVPDEFMADFPAMQSFIDARLPYMVDLETEFQILYGDGLGNNLKGIFTNADVQARAIDGTSGTTVAESLKKGLTDIRVGSRFIPTGFAFHPYDWETASLLKDSEGRFLAGGPFYAPFGIGMFVEINTFWGKPVVVSDSVNYGSPVAGAWNLGAQYFMREGMRLETTNANEDDFRRNLICIRAEHRLALATYRPVAFLEFTGFPART